MSLLSEPALAPELLDAAPAEPPARHSRTVLCVDDEPYILSALGRLLRQTGHRILTAQDGQEALSLLEAHKVDLLISDMRMPAMSGAELMSQTRVRWPDVTRILLTGHADIHVTIAAINEGQVHRYLTKPWSDAELLLAIKEVFEHKQLAEEKSRLEALTLSQNEALRTLNTNLEGLVAARTHELAQANERLKKSYFTSIKSFSNLLELRGGQLMGHARRVADLSLKTAKALNLGEVTSNDVLIAALLHDIGHIGLPDALLSKPAAHLTPAEATAYRLHPLYGEQALMGQDDMQGAAVIIRSHHERFDGQGFPEGLKGEEIPIGARILAVVDTYEDLLHGQLVPEHVRSEHARALMWRGRGTQFDPWVLDAFMSLFENGQEPPSDPHAILRRPDELEPGMIMARDFLSPQGVLLLAAEHTLSRDLIDRIRLFERRSGRSVLLATRPQ